MTFTYIARGTLAALFVLASSLSASAQQPTLAASVNGSFVTVQWTPIPGAQAYDIAVSGTLSGATSVPANPTSYVVNAGPGTYTLQIRARAGNLVGPFSNAVTVTVG